MGQTTQIPVTIPSLPPPQKYSVSANIPVTIPSLSPHNIKLKTAKADFTKLDQLLAAKNWQDADIEMGNVMCKIMGRKKEGYLTEDNCKNFPREELKIIDSLWVHNSNGYYGFSVLKDIWTSAKIGGKVGEYDYNKFCKLGDEVGWRKRGNWLYSYSDLSLNLVPSIKGQFPIWNGGVGLRGWGGFPFLL